MLRSSQQTMTSSRNPGLIVLQRNEGNSCASDRSTGGRHHRRHPMTMSQNRQWPNGIEASFPPVWDPVGRSGAYRPRGIGAGDRWRPDNPGTRRNRTRARTHDAKRAFVSGYLIWVAVEPVSLASFLLTSGCPETKMVSEGAACRAIKPLSLNGPRSLLLC